MQLKNVLGSSRLLRLAGGLAFGKPHIHSSTVKTHNENHHHHHYASVEYIGPTSQAYERGLS